jgi:tRNA 2-thiouridine synthesizing protein E
MTLQIAHHIIATDKDGYLINTKDWSKAIAEALAEKEGIKLTSAHWEIIELLKAFYRDFQLAPAMRPLVKYTKQQLGSEKGSSIYLTNLFPPNPALIASKIAGLPRPANCF